jgi:hypothetical protein
MYIVPVLSVALALVLFAGSRASARDRRALTAWMEGARAS